MALGRILGSVFVYAGLTLDFVGLISAYMPPSWPGIHTPLQAVLLVGSGFVLVVAGWFLPAQATRVTTPWCRLDEYVPVYQFWEFHSIVVAASEERVYAAIKAVTANEISLFRTFTWIRRFGRAGPQGILNPPPHEPVLQLATRTSFILLADEPNREIALGIAVIAPPGWRRKESFTPESFKSLRAPGFALAAMNFRLEDGGPGAVRVTTETRIHATDATSRRRFAIYWRTIYPGSSLLRYTWLRAIKRRAES